MALTLRDVQGRGCDERIRRGAKTERENREKTSIFLRSILRRREEEKESIEKGHGSLILTILVKGDGQ